MDYSKLTDEEYDRILVGIIGDIPAGSLIQIPGAYEVFSEHFNNDVLSVWEERQLMEQEDDS